MGYSYKKALERLCSYAYENGFKKVVLNHTGTSRMTWRHGTLNDFISIYIEDGYSLEIKTYIFLHELGHYKLRRDWVKFERRFPITAYAEERSEMGDKRYVRRNLYKVSSLEEEYMAWEEGLRLGYRMGIRIDQSKFMEFKSKCLRGYITYYA